MATQSPVSPISGVSPPVRRDDERRFVSFDDLYACRGCDWLHFRHELNPSELARCSRCGDVLYTRKPHTIDRTLAASLAGIVLLLLSLILPFLSMSRGGIESDISVLDAVSALWASDMRWLGLLTLSLIVLLPLTRLALLVYVLTRLRLHLRILPAMRRAFRWAVILEPWAMADIFILGVVVSLVKIAALATLDIGPAFWALIGLVGTTILIDVVLCQDSVWKRLNIPRA